MSNVIVVLTRSQHMALISILSTYMRSDGPQVSVDVVNDVETTTGELLSLVVDAGWATFVPSNNPASLVGANVHPVEGGNFSGWMAVPRDFRRPGESDNEVALRYLEHLNEKEGEG